jgi:hypothetical protein
VLKEIERCYKQVMILKESTVRFEVLKEVLLKIQVLWDVTSCLLQNGYPHFEGS